MFSKKTVFCRLWCATYVQILFRAKILTVKVTKSWNCINFRVSAMKFDQMFLFSQRLRIDVIHNESEVLHLNSFKIIISCQSIRFSPLKM